MSKLSSFRFVGGVPVVVAVMVVALLGGCRQAMSTSPTPEGKDKGEITISPKQALMGTWQTVEEERDDNGNVTGVKTSTLTFTKTRAILLFTERDGAGAIVEADWCQCESGTWEADENTITKTRVPWLSDANDWGSEKVSVSRNYAFVDDAKKVLRVHSWEGHEPETSFHRYTRVENPIPGGSVTGVWTGDIEWPPRSPGEQRITRWTLTLGESFTEHAVETTTVPGVAPTVQDFVLSGSAIHDNDDYVLSVTVESHTRTLDGAPTPTRVSPGHVLRYAYAPTGNPDEIAVSLWWAEQVYSPDAQTWVDRETSEDRRTFADGRYQLRLKRINENHYLGSTGDRTAFESVTAD